MGGVAGYAMRGVDFTCEADVVVIGEQVAAVRSYDIRLDAINASISAIVQRIAASSGIRT